MCYNSAPLGFLLNTIFKKLRKFNSEQIEQMIEAYKNGSTLEEVGRKFDGVSKERIRLIFEKAGVSRRGKTLSDKFIESRKNNAAKRRKNLPREELEKMYCEQKLSAKQIGDLLKRNASTV